MGWFVDSALVVPFILPLGLRLPPLLSDADKEGGEMPRGRGADGRMATSWRDTRKRGGDWRLEPKHVRVGLLIEREQEAEAEEEEEEEEEEGVVAEPSSAAAAVVDEVVMEKKRCRQDWVGAACVVTSSTGCCHG